LNERLAYIDHRDNLIIKIITDKPAYSPHDSISIKLRITDMDGNPVKGNFAMAVTDNDQVRPDSLNENIISRMLLTSDLKGYIEEPGYYFGSNKKAKQALDNLLLTQGWIGYDWKQVFDPPKITFQPETEMQVKGQVYNVLNKPVKGTHVLLFSKKPSILMDTTTNDEGRFVFDRFPSVDTPVFILKATNKNGKSFNVDIRMEEIKPPDFIKPSSPRTMPWYVNTDTSLLNFTRTDAKAKQVQYIPQSGHLLREVKIMAKKIVKESQNLNGPGNADIVLNEKDLEAAGKKTWLQLLQENVPKFSDGFFASGGSKGLKDFYLGEFVTNEGSIIKKIDAPQEWYFVNGKPLMLIVDGIAIGQIITLDNFRDLKDYLEYHSAEDIKGLEVIYSTRYAAAYFTRYQPYSPIPLVESAMKDRAGPVLISPSDIAFVEITTRSGHGPAIDYTPGMYMYKPLPLNWPKQFYKPKYSVKDTVKHLQDLRSTIDWEPNINTNSKGEARLWFYAADKPSTYTIIIEGTEMNGLLGYKKERIIISPAIEKTK
jgi:hypothetical protein